MRQKELSIPSSMNGIEYPRAGKFDNLETNIMSKWIIYRSKFLTIGFAEFQKVLQPLVIRIISAYVSGLCKQGSFRFRKARSVTELARKQKQNKKILIIIIRLKEGKTERKEIIRGQDRSPFGFRVTTTVRNIVIHSIFGHRLSG